MNQTSNRIFDEMAKLFGNAATAAQSLRSEIDALIRSQAERVLNELDVVQRDEFDAMREMTRKAREENERLEARIAVLEAKLGVAVAAEKGGKAEAKPAKRRASPRKTTTRAKA